MEITYDQLMNEMINDTKNMLILGKAGSGKSHLIKELSKVRDDILLTAPTGIAAMNIGGRTIDSLFGIRPYCHDYSSMPRLNECDKKSIMKASILLIDEISMVKFNTLDKVNNILKTIRRTTLPFGGLRLILFGDLMQLESVVDEYESLIISIEYHDFNGDAGFYNARSMKEGNFLIDNFNFFFLRHNFRQNNDTVFQTILDEIRDGKLSLTIKNKINKQFKKTNDYFKLYLENYHFLTITNNKASSINRKIIDKMTGVRYIAEPVICYSKPCNEIISKSPIDKTITIKNGMKVMFVINDKGIDRRWANGTTGTVEKVRQFNGNIISVKIKVNQNGKTMFYDVMRVKSNIIGIINGLPEIVGYVENFPFIPAFATTIDKVQGMTLSKAAIVLEKVSRPNQIYVALSRVGSFKDLIILERKLTSQDVKISRYLTKFIKEIEAKMQDVFINKG